jgi:hypothetical protein
MILNSKKRVGVDFSSVQTTTELVSGSGGKKICITDINLYIGGAAVVSLWSNGQQIFRTVTSAAQMVDFLGIDLPGKGGGNLSIDITTAVAVVGNIFYYEDLVG